jgi:hypothetical protein
VDTARLTSLEQLFDEFRLLERLASGQRYSAAGLFIEHTVPLDFRQDVVDAHPASGHLASVSKASTRTTPATLAETFINPDLAAFHR